MVSASQDTDLGQNELWTERLPLHCWRLQRFLPQSLISLLGGAGESQGLLRRARLEAEKVAHCTISMLTTSRTRSDKRSPWKDTKIHC